MKMDVAVGGGGGTSVGLADLLIVLASAPPARPLAYSLGTGTRPPSKTC